MHRHFSSFLMGGFAGANFKFWDGRRIDCIAGARHDVHCALDYSILADVGIRTLRDAFRWPLIEKVPGEYDWSSIRPMLAAASDGGMQVIWDLFHFGLPDHVDALSPLFPRQFADFALNAALLVEELKSSGEPPWWCLTNEISYFCYAAGQEAYMSPAAAGHADELKCQLVKAYFAAQAAVKSVNPQARFLSTDPLICVSNESGVMRDACDNALAAWDMLLGLRNPELGGGSAAIDVIGVNYYPGNQWRSEDGRRLGMGERGYRPLHLLLQDIWQRYGKPIILSETGAERPNGANWLRYVLEEVHQARRDGVPVQGVCLYPVMDYPGWVNSRHCATGLIETDAEFDKRSISSDLLAVLAHHSVC